VLRHILCLPVAQVLKVFLCHATAHFVPSRGTSLKSLFVPCYGTFCAFPWHISLKSLFVPCYGTFRAFPWHISLKSLFVPCYGTFCAFPWHILCLSVAHGILFPLVKNCKSSIASQELQVKNCKSRIASQELQVKNCKCKSRIAK
jgi:hypothetical protein